MADGLTAELKDYLFDAIGPAFSGRSVSSEPLLVDYVSAGHFEVFHELIDEAESFADGSGELAGKLMPAIADTTEVIMAYEEKYSGAQGRQEKLKRDLSALGEALESRFVLEDQLIAGLHTRHRRLVANAPSTGQAPQSA